MCVHTSATVCAGACVHTCGCMGAPLPHLALSLLPLLLTTGSDPLEKEGREGCLRGFFLRASASTCLVFRT